MGSGKTAVGLELAARLEVPFVDTDLLVEKTAGRSIPEIFREEGEEGFRRLETQAVADATTARDARVIATGGGAVLRPENWSRLSACGITIWLAAGPGTIVERLYPGQENAADSRPLLAGADPLARITCLLEERRPLYARARLQVGTDGQAVSQVVETILGQLDRRFPSWRAADSPGELD